MVEFESFAREDDGRETEQEITEIRPVSEIFPGSDIVEMASRQAAAESLTKLPKF